MRRSLQVTSCFAVAKPLEAFFRHGEDGEYDAPTSPGDSKHQPGLGDIDIKNYRTE